MTSKELFIAGIRLFGVWELLRVIEYAIAAFDFTVGFASNPSSSVHACYTHGSAYFVVGLYLLGGAPHVVRFFYPPTSHPTDSEHSPTTPSA